MRSNNTSIHVVLVYVSVESFNIGCTSGFGLLDQDLYKAYTNTRNRHTHTHIKDTHTYTHGQVDNFGFTNGSK